MTEAVAYFISQIWGVILTLRDTVSVWDIIDVLIIAFLIYRILSFMEKTSASNVIRGILSLLVIAWIAAFFNMNILSYVLSQAMQMGIIVIVVLFQPEIRKLFERVGSAVLTQYLEGGADM